jgi:uncharacterized membrane protein
MKYNWLLVLGIILVAVGFVLPIINYFVVYQPPNSYYPSGTITSPNDPYLDKNSLVYIGSILGQIAIISGATCIAIAIVLGIIGYIEAQKKVK